MMTSYRLEQAIKKLYTAFHNDTLHPECCKSCAVGNICDNTESWKYLSDTHGSVILNYVGRVNETFGKKINGYKPSELLQIEAVFLQGCGYSLPLKRKSVRPKDPTSKEILFNGLCAVITYMCALDGVDNVLDYSRLFEFEDNEPVHMLVPNLV